MPKPANKYAPLAPVPPAGDTTPDATDVAVAAQDEKVTTILLSEAPQMTEAQFFALKPELEAARAAIGQIETEAKSIIATVEAKAAAKAAEHAAAVAAAQVVIATATAEVKAIHATVEAEVKSKLDARNAAIATFQPLEAKSLSYFARLGVTLPATQFAPVASFLNPSKPTATEAEAEGTVKTRHRTHEIVGQTAKGRDVYAPASPKGPDGKFTCTKCNVDGPYKADDKAVLFD